MISKFGSIKVDDKEEPAFTGSRIQASEFLMLMVDSPPPIPMLLAKLCPRQYRFDYKLKQ